MLRVRFDEAGGGPSSISVKVTCTGASILGRQFDTQRGFPSVDRVLEYPFTVAGQSNCTIEVFDVIDDDQLGVTVGGVRVERANTVVTRSAEKEVKAMFGPITFDADTEVVLRARVSPRRLLPQRIFASIVAEFADQFKFTVSPFDCVGVVWNGTFSTSWQVDGEFPGVTSASCKIRFVPTSRGVITDFRTHLFFVNGRVVIPTVNPDGSVVLDFPMSQSSAIRVISPSTPAPPLPTTVPSTTPSRTKKTARPKTTSKATSVSNPSRSNRICARRINGRWRVVPCPK